MKLCFKLHPKKFWKKGLGYFITKIKILRKKKRKNFSPFVVKSNSKVETYYRNSIFFLFLPFFFLSKLFYKRFLKKHQSQFPFVLRIFFFFISQKKERCANFLRDSKSMKKLVWELEMADLKNQPFLSALKGKKIGKEARSKCRFPKGKRSNLRFDWDLCWHHFDWESNQSSRRNWLRKKKARGSLSTRFYVFAWTCKKTNPKASPKSVIPKQTKAVVKISPIIYFL